MTFASVFKSRIVPVFCILLVGCGGVGGDDEPRSVDEGRSVTAQDLQNQTFIIADGGVFHEGLSNQEVTLAFGAFSGSSGGFAIISQKGTAIGQVTFGSCKFVITQTTFVPSQGPQTGDQIVARPCNVSDAATLLMTNVESGNSTEALLRISPDPTDLSGVAATLTGNPDFATVAVHENGEKLLAMTKVDTVGNVISVTGAVWTSSTGESIVVSLGENGLPKRAVFNNEVVALYSNYTAGTVDIAVILPDRTYQLFRDVSVDPLLIAKLLLESSDPFSPSPESSPNAFLRKPFEKVQDTVRMSSLGLSAGTCFMSIVAAAVTGGAGAVVAGRTAVLACTSTLVSSLNNTFENTPLDLTEAGFTIIGCSDLGLQDPVNLAECILALIARGFDIVNAASALTNAERPAQEALIRPVVVTIGSPRNGETFEEGSLVHFWGEATYENGRVFWANYTWVSSINNQIGKTSSFLSSILSQGSHTIALFAVDPEGRGGSASITITITRSGGSGGGTNPWIGNWVQVNFLLIDDNGVWDEDDLSGIGFVSRITETEWIETDGFGHGCSVIFVYSVDTNYRYSKKAIDKSSNCPAFPLSLLDDAGRLEFSADHQFMIQYFGLGPGDDIVAFKWMRQ